ncbi:reverse transcriptase [Gossypium australe]|uniref:Reverse transcriptase n=1 Tax=Gossypium australe TaxID=47621 RepID=A0A5B6W7U1_9ROSI|nr:reverse transcriptase [Gossypium australe]
MNEREIEDIDRAYFFNLFESKGVGDVKHILSRVKSCISDSMNQILTASYIDAEIAEALKGMGPTKASSFDGFPTIFYQKFWHIIGKDTSEFCLDVLNHGHSLDEINRTQLVLIPKTANPINLKNSHPISLCTVIYKIIAKSVANRLQKSEFVPGRLIIDNVLLAYEVLHSFKNKRSGRKCFMALKLDMSKAYDRVEWPFIKGVMSKLGFADGFIDFIIYCINSVQYSILINSEEGLSFRSTRGMSALMRLACHKGKICGAKVCRASPSITHLMFVDDCILFGEVSNRGISVLKEILRECEVCSRQCVNFEKSTVLNVRCSIDPEKYLGLPNMVGQKRKLAFQYLKDRLKQKINS